MACVSVSLDPILTLILTVIVIGDAKSEVL